MKQDDHGTTPNWLHEAHKELTRVRAINAELVGACELALADVRQALQSIRNGDPINDTIFILEYWMEKGGATIAKARGENQ